MNTKYNDLEKEQKELLFCLLGADNWETGEQLGQKLNWKRKKFQQNMNALISNLEGLCTIETQKNKGYLLIAISDDLRISILKDISLNGAFFNLNARRSMIVLDLLFRDDYVSMDKLAETYYLSKTVVYNEINHLKRWFSRSGDLELEVSTKNGIKINGSENGKRFCCTAYVQLDMLKLIGLEQMSIMRYEGVMKSSSVVLKNLIKTTGNFMSGEEFSAILRYIGMTQLRGSLGYVLDEKYEELTEEKYSTFFKELIEATGYAFSGSEKTIIKKMIEHSNLIQMNEISDFDATIGKQFLSEVCRLCNFKEDEFADTEDIFTRNMANMLHRLGHSKHSVNYYDKDILKKYLLSHHLTTRAFKNMRIEVSRSDILDMATYVGGVIDNIPFKSKAKVLLVGGQNFQILEQIREKVLHFLPFVPEKFDLYPGYMVDNDLCNKYDLLLTTEPEILLTNDKFIITPVIMTDSNSNDLESKLKNWVSEYRLLLVDELRDTISISNQDKISDLEGVIPEEILKMSTYQFRDDGLLVVIFSEENVKDGIEKIELVNAFSYEYHSISKIMFVQYNETKENLIEYFYCLSKIL